MRNQRHHPGIVRTRAHLAEPDLIPFDEQLHAEEAPATERFRYYFCYFSGACEGLTRHRLRLPGLLVVAVLLPVPDRLTKAGAVAVTDGEQGDLVIEVDEALDNDLAAARAPALLRVLPGGINLVPG